MRRSTKDRIRIPEGWVKACCGVLNLRVDSFSNECGRVTQSVVCTKCGAKLYPKGDD